MDKKLILLVDDEPEILELLKKRLEKNDYNVIFAHDAATCLEKAQNEKPDLIVLDVVFPSGPDGFEIKGRLKNDAFTQGIPVIMLTGLVQHECLSVNPERGAECIIPKPFCYEELLSKINQILKTKPKGALS